MIVLAGHNSYGEVLMLRHPTNGRAVHHGRKPARIIHNSTMQQLGIAPRVKMTRQQIAVLAQKRRRSRISD
jgi:hypothetical protein